MCHKKKIILQTIKINKMHRILHLENLKMKKVTLMDLTFQIQM